MFHAVVHHSHHSSPTIFKFFSLSTSICLCIYILYICIGNNRKYNYIMNIQAFVRGGAMQSSSIKRVTGYIIRLSMGQSFPSDRPTALCCIPAYFAHCVYDCCTSIFTRHIGPTRVRTEGKR